MGVTPGRLAANTAGPLITTQPESQTVIVGNDATFSVAATGDNLRYQWRFNEASILDGTNTTYTLRNVQTANAGEYHLVVWNETGSVSSTTATLTVSKAPPVISALADQTTLEETALGPISFNVTSGDSDSLPEELIVSWESSDPNLVPVSGITWEGAGSNRTLTIMPATDQFGACTITLTVTDPEGNAATTSFTVTVKPVNDPPQFVGAPPFVVEPNQTFFYTVNVVDPDPGDSLQLAAISLPEWLSFDHTTGVLTGTPPPSGSDGYGVTLYVRDAAGASAVNGFRIWTKDKIRLTDASDVQHKREGLVNHIWGTNGWPSSGAVTAVKTGYSNRCYDLIRNEVGNLARIDIYTITMAYGIESHVYHFLPVRGNGRLFLFHAGHNSAGFQSDDVSMNNGGAEPGLVLPRLLKEGYSVLAFSMPIYNGYPLPTVESGTGTVTLRSHEDMFTYLEKPFRFFLEPIVVALNHVADHYDYKNTYMTGLSGGGWTTTIYAALDPRIERSYPVAGSVPIYLRYGGVEAEQTDPQFYQSANYEELYVMGSHGLNRFQLQILNRYDPCCFRGSDYVYWVDDVKQATRSLGEGAYEFFLDETHQEHKISPVGLGAILNSLPPTFDPIANLVLDQGGGGQTVPLTGITPALLSRTNTLVITAESDSPELVGNLSADYTSPSASGSLHFKPQPGAFGKATVTVAISDGQSVHSTFQRRFTVTVRPSPPVVEWLTPTDGTILEAFQPLRLEADAFSPYSLIRLVEFWTDTKCVAIATNEPYIATCTNLDAGSYRLFAVAHDEWATSVSAPVTLTVLTPNQPPLIQWTSPAEDTILDPFDPVTLTVAATDPDGDVARVEFFAGAEMIGAVTEPPYRLSWSDLAPGSYRLHAVAVDNRGGTTTSDSIELTVMPLNQLPVVQLLSPTDGLTLEAVEPVTIEARASDPDGTIVRLEIRDGTNTIGIITNSQSLSITRDHLGPGRHELSAVAIDNGGGRGESLPVTVIVLPPNLPPIIRWMTPANGAVFDASEVITLQATAADLDGLVERVEFRDGTCVIGVLTTAPFSLTWTNASLGKHSLTIVAVDDRGTAVESEAINLTVVEAASSHPPIIESLQRYGDGRFELRIAGPDGYLAVVETTLDWHNWTPLSTSQIANGSVIVQHEADVPVTARFYRVRLERPAF